jgi:hypothetical protein
MTLPTAHAVTPSGSHSSPEAGPARRSWGSVVALVLLAIGPLLPTLRASFVYDDAWIIRDNATLRGWSALWRVWSLPYWPQEGPDRFGLYRPLHIAVLATIWNAGGGSARWFHVYALVLAALATLALWWLLRRAVQPAAALVAAIWFATHPLHVEAIASVVNSSELLVLLFTIAIVRVLLAAENPSHDALGWGRALLVAALALGALLCKESGLFAIPLALLTVWGWRRATGTTTTMRQVTWHARLALVISAVFLGVALAGRARVLGAPIARHSIAAVGLESLTQPQRARVMLSLWPHMAGMLALPSDLTPYYGPTVIPPNTGALALLSVVVATACLALVILAARRGDRRPLVAVGWMALTYLPASNLITAAGPILSDRTLFGPTVGLAMLIAWGLDRLPSLSRQVASALLALVILRGVVVSTSYAIAWTTQPSLWKRMVAAVPREPMGYLLLSIDAKLHGDTSRAFVMIGRAYALDSTDKPTRLEYGQLLYAVHRYPEAVHMLTPLLRDSDAVNERKFVSLYLDAVGRANGAQAVADAARRLIGTDAAPIPALYLGAAEERLGRPTVAESVYAAALRASPGDTALANRRAAVRHSPPHQ